METTGLALMRVPFPAHQISQIPKGGVKLSYVGHAALTDRLLDADPMWTWEPVAMDERGLPCLDGFGGMWIRLTVCGVTRLGYGHAGTKEGGDAIKEIIGDALRNAAMRFGAALDLWHKGELHKDDTDSLVPVLEASIEAEKVKRRSELDEFTLDMIEAFKLGEKTKVLEMWYAEPRAFKSGDELEYCWNNLRAESAIRTMLQANNPARDHPAKPQIQKSAAGPGLKKVGKPITNGATQ
jgi:hypothetical protein